MKKAERIAYLLEELKKELETIPEEVKLLSNKMSEYDILNSEVYHSILTFNPSASESAKLIGSWKKQLLNRKATKQELASLNGLRDVESLNQLITKMLEKLQSPKCQNTFSFQTTMAQEVIFDSFNNYEERNNYPFEIKPKPHFLNPEIILEESVKTDVCEGCDEIVDAEETMDAGKEKSEENKRELIRERFKENVIKVIKHKGYYFIYDGINVVTFCTSLSDVFYFIKRNECRNLCFDVNISEEELRKVVQVILDVFEKESEQKRFIKMIRLQRFNVKPSVKQKCVTFLQSKNKSA